MVSLEEQLDAQNESVELADNRSLNSLDKNLENELLKNTVHVVLSELSEIEKSVLEKRFGINNNKPMTLRQIGDEFNVGLQQYKEVS